MAFVTVCPHVEMGVVERYKSGKCAQCQRKRTATKRAQNPERARVAARQWARDNPERKKAQDKAWAAANWQKKLETQRRLKGIVYAVHESCEGLIRAQGGKCANPRCQIMLSDLPTKQVHVDHDHNIVGKPNVRGVLCGGCNTGIGKMGDDPARCLGAFEYLTAAQQRLRNAG